MSSIVEKKSSWPNVLEQSYTVCGVVLFSNRRKSLFGSYRFRELELMADNMAAGWQAGMEQ